MCRIPAQERKKMRRNSLSKIILFVIAISNRSRPSVRHYALSSGLFWEMEANRFFCNLPGDWKCARASGGKICEIEEV